MIEEIPESPASHAAGTHWQSALAELIAARIELIRLEAKDTAQVIATKALHAVTLILIIGLGWLCLLAGLIGLLHHFTQWPWWGCALVFAGIHAALALCFAVLLKRPSPPAFPLTCEEFHKDRLWMQSLKTPPAKH